MVRRVSFRLLAIVMALAGTSLAVGATAASAKPAKPAKPTSVTVAGEGVETVSFHAETDPALFGALIDQVSWLSGAGHSSAPKSADLGPKYTVVVLINDAAKQTYDLYPLAKGGPRAFRPAKQPDGRRPGAAWFFGRLNMSETLRAAGMPLPEQPDPISGGIGGGERVIPDEALNPGEQVDQLFADLRRLLLLNGAVLLAITVGLAGIALLVRRRTR